MRKSVIICVQGSFISKYLRKYKSDKTITTIDKHKSKKNVEKYFEVYVYVKKLAF